MNNKIRLISLVSALLCTPLIHAGGMGDVGNCSTAFIGLEGGYTTANISNYNFAFGDIALDSVRKNQNYSGRVYAGMINMFDEQFGVTGEIGWGYYGRVTLSPDFTAFPAGFADIGDDFTLQHTLTGFDALFGVNWVQSGFGLSFKAGAMIQNLQRETNLVLFLDPDVFPIAAYNEKENRTGVLPEIRIGASYSFDSNWAITAAYQLAWGATPKTSALFNDTGALSLVTNNLNPTLNSFLLGVLITL
jgi:hypothetical protein